MLLLYRIFFSLLFFSLMRGGMEKVNEEKHCNQLDLVYRHDVYVSYTWVSKCNGRVDEIMFIFPSSFTTIQCEKKKEEKKKELGE